jgi:SET domain-containing protein|tara:strand:- start:2281 stop:2871 length:591 start_codon:yes stop_codon:yes gene_type:complete
MISLQHKKDYLKHLNDNTFCRLGSSRISGVGVFALVDIPENINPFISFPFREELSIDVSPQELSSLRQEVQEYIKDFFAQDSRCNYPVKATGLNDLNITHYVNHSESANLHIDTGSPLPSASTKNESPQDSRPSPPSPLHGALNTFLTKRRVLRGEELTCNYRGFLSVNNNTDQFNFLSREDEAGISIYEHKGGKV